MELGEGMRIVAPDSGDGADCRITVRPEKIRIGAAERRERLAGPRDGGRAGLPRLALADRGRDRHRASG